LQQKHDIQIPHLLDHQDVKCFITGQRMSASFINRAQGKRRWL